MPKSLLFLFACCWQCDGVASIVGVFGKVAGRPGFVLQPLPNSVHPRLAAIVAPFIDPISSVALDYLPAEQLVALKQVPGLSGISVQTFIQTNEDLLISDALAIAEDEYGDMNVASRDCMIADLKNLLRWLSLLLPLAESMECPDGTSLVNQDSLVIACKDFFSPVVAPNEPPPVKVDRGIFICAVVALGVVLNTRANKVGGVGGAWNEMNGKVIYNRLCFSLRTAVYAR